MKPIRIVIYKFKAICNYHIKLLLKSIVTVSTCQEYFLYLCLDYNHFFLISIKLKSKK